MKMTDKILDWNSIRTDNLGIKKPKVYGGAGSYREAIQKSYEAEEQALLEKSLRKAKEEELKPKLLKRLINREPIHILKSFPNLTESLGGQTQDEEDDGFYQVIKSASSGAKFMEVVETIPEGEVLVYKGQDKTLRQLIFKGKHGRDYLIYQDPIVAFQGKEVENPGLTGLILNSDINK